MARALVELPAAGKLFAGRPIFLVLLSVILAGCSNQTAVEEQAADQEKSQSRATSSVDANDSDADDSDADEGDQLTVGMKAPEIEIAQWVKGKPVEAFKPGHTYVVEFWATWCGPCRAGMPHISKLQELHKDDVTFIGVTREDQETVAKFLEKPQTEESEKTWDDVIAYTLAIDDNDQTSDAYMRAAGQNGIPCAFVVGPDAVVEWIGHPARIDQPLEQIVAGTWDREQYLAQREEEQRAAAAMQNAMQLLRKAQEDGDWDEAINAIDALIEQKPEQLGFQMLKFNVLVRAERDEEAIDAAKQLGEDQEDDPELLNSLAWTLATGEPRPAGSLELALQFAKRANELNKGEDASILDTVAKVYAEQGKLDEAIAWQEKAVEQGDGAEEWKATLEAYQAEQKKAEAADAPAAAEEEADAAEETDATDKETTDKEADDKEADDKEADDKEASVSPKLSNSIFLSANFAPPRTDSECA